GRCLEELVYFDPDGIWHEFPSEEREGTEPECDAEYLRQPGIQDHGIELAERVPVDLRSWPRAPQFELGKDGTDPAPNAPRRRHLPWIDKLNQVWSMHGRDEHIAARARYSYHLLYSPERRIYPHHHAECEHQVKVVVGKRKMPHV